MLSRKDKPMTEFDNNLKLHIEQFLRAEKRLLYEIAGHYDGTPIDDPDLEKPIQERVEEIKTDPHALQEFLRKNKDGCDKFANPKDGKDACYLARYTFAVRAAQRVLGEPLYPWPPLMQQLLAQVTHPDLKRLVKEDSIPNAPQQQETPAPAPELADPTPSIDFQRLIVDMVRRSIQEVEQTIK